MNNTVVALINILALGAVLLVNALANILPINGYNTGQISDFYPSLFTPAGFTFAIWSVIYLLLIAFSVFQFRLRSKPFFMELSLWFWISCIANASWIMAWHYLFTWASVVIMITLLFSLIKIFLLITKETEMSWVEQVFLKLPFTIYFSWICVATIANLSALLVSIKWNGGILAPEQWAILMTIIATLLGTMIAVEKKTPSFLLVILWALFGIYSKQKSGLYEIIATAAVVEMTVLAVVFGILLIRPNLISRQAT